MTKKRGLRIAFDGPDGVGKTTQIELTTTWLEGLGYEVYNSRASGGTPIGEQLRKVALSPLPRSAETDIHINVAMNTTTGEAIQERSKDGDLCVVDRSPLAILAYNTFGSQLKDQAKGYREMEGVFMLWDLDILVYFDADQKVIDERRKARTDKPTDFYERLGKGYHQRVRQGYAVGFDYLQKSPKLVKHLYSINAEPSVGTVQTSIRELLQKVLSA